MCSKSNGSVGPVHAEVDRMKQTGRWDKKRLYRATLLYQDEPRFPTALGRVCYEEGNTPGAVHALREARRRLMLQLEVNPGDGPLLEELQLTENDLAEAEAALPA